MAENPYEVSRSRGLGSLEEPEGGPEAPEKGQLASPERQEGPGKFRMMRGNVVMVVLFVGAASLVYGLSIRKGPAMASAQQKVVESQVDSAILRLSGALGAGAGAPNPGRISCELLKKFYDQISERQVPLRRLQKDPFRFVPPPSPQPVVTSGGQNSLTAPAQLDAKDQTREAAMARLAKLYLQAIQRGQSGAVAIISNNLVSEGQRIEGFTVKRITLNEVILSWENEEYVLSMP
ncbi:MAG: hypothetical protein AMJ81_07780 [Phycisphaerae bacterium SM23_33]|nr:MAG: hypothetical protein AMJ81_07780 [Phycisphaerae bacterium SM23_33]